MSKVDILGVHVDNIDKDEVQRRIEESITQNRKDVYAYVNINAINVPRRNPRFRDILNRASVVYCDGEGVRIGARILGVQLPPRIVLTYWVWDLCRLVEHKGFTVFFLGGTEDTIERAVKNVRDRHRRIQIVGWHHGYYQKNGAGNDKVLDMICKAKPNILFVGFGMPMQEEWIESNLERLEANAILPSGSMIEYIAGNKHPAPLWMANHGMEWVYRLIQEPRRLMGRYLIGNPAFVFQVLLQAKKGGGHR
ncbi:MAG: WecB/TagA/CpsF family glycosyltransferase [Ignavibacteria bacterium]|nr:WecB/TagA/CpsF family glycosyltransferase [Ignavibacteria bacterium]